MRILIGCILILSIGLWILLGSSPQAPLHHISQQEAAAYCSSGAVGPEQSSTEGVTDGKPDVHSYYPCSDGSVIAAYQH